MAGLINNGHGAWLAALGGNITPAKVKVVQHLLGSRLASEGLLPPGIWVKNATVMHEGMEGGLLSLMSKLGAPVNFPAYDIGVNHDVNTVAPWIQAFGMDIVEDILKAARQVPGAITTDATSTDQTEGMSLDNVEINVALDHALFAQWKTAVQEGRLAAADTLATAATPWGSIMRRACIFHEANCRVKVKDSDQRRGELNTWMKYYGRLAAKATFEAVTVGMSSSTCLLSATVKSAITYVLRFPGAEEDDFLLSIRSAAAVLMTCSKKSVKQWYGTEAETAITYVMQIVGAIFGPMAGTNCAIRAARVVREWSILDGRFSYWKKNFGTPADEHGGWHFAEELVVRPLFKWMTASWDFMRANVINAAIVPTNPGTLEVTLSEQVMRTTPTYSLMSTALSRMVLNKRETHDQFQGSEEEESNSDDTTESMDDSDDDTSDTSESESDSPPASAVKKKPTFHGKKKKKAQNSTAKKKATFTKQQKAPYNAKMKAKKAQFKKSNKDQKKGKKGKKGKSG